MITLLTLAYLLAPAAIMAVVQTAEGWKLRMKADGTYAVRR